MLVLTAVSSMKPQSCWVEEPCSRIRRRRRTPHPSSLDSGKAYAISLAWLLSTIDCSHEAPICTLSSDRPFTHSM